jgi:CarboxypepD_reg-like domain
MTHSLRTWGLFVALLLGFWTTTTAQQKKYTLSGFVRDQETGEDLTGAQVLVPSAGTGAYCNTYGFYSLTLPEGDYDVIVRYMGFDDDSLTIALHQDISQNIELREQSVQVKTVEITDKAKEDHVKGLDMSVEKMSLREIRKLPAFMGEVDVIRTIQLLPGVIPVGEGITGYYVRGGQSNQNLVLLDNATVYNASHLLGFFSVFNADALRDEYKLYKGGIPAQYGTRLSSVLDLHMKEGNAKQWHASGGLGAISSRLTIEGPIVKDRVSFMASGRRTYADVFLLAAKDENLKATKLYFYDFNAKINWRISDKDRLFASGYFGRDVFKFRKLFSNDWGNATGSLRWNHLFSDKLFNNATLIFSDFFYGFEAETFTGDRFEFSSGIRDFTFKDDVTWFASPKNQVQFGIDATLHRFNPGIFKPLGESFLQPTNVSPDYALETAIYASNEQTINDRLSLVYGLRWSQFAQIGPGDEYRYDSTGQKQIDTTTFKSGELIQLYHGLEPRFSARYMVGAHNSLKASYMRTRQYLHLASNSTASFPWDIWIPSSRHIEPQIADQVALGYFHNLLDNRLEASVEVYYKDMRNQIDFKNGAELILNPTIETEILKGDGYAYGAEFMLRKTSGPITGWISYTLSNAMRQIKGINNGNPYPANSNRKHDISVAGSWQISPRFNVGATWVYASGRPVTFPVGGYRVDSVFVPLYGDRNSSKLPDYHRLDLSLTIDGKTREAQEGKRRLESSWNFTCYNAYGRRNAFSVDFREEQQADPNNPGQQITVRNAYKTYLFRWVPSITWNFKF